LHDKGPDLPEQLSGSQKALCHTQSKNQYHKQKLQIVGGQRQHIGVSKWLHFGYWKKILWLTWLDQNFGSIFAFLNSYYQLLINN